MSEEVAILVIAEPSDEGEKRGGEEGGGELPKLGRVVRGTATDGGFHPPEEAAGLLLVAPNFFDPGWSSGIRDGVSN